MGTHDPDKLIRERRRQLSDVMRRTKIRLWQVATELKGYSDCQAEYEAVASAASLVDEAWGILDPKRE